MSYTKLREAIEALPYAFVDRERGQGRVVDLDSVLRALAEAQLKADWVKDSLVFARVESRCLTPEKQAEWLRARILEVVDAMDDTVPLYRQPAPKAPEPYPLPARQVDESANLRALDEAPSEAQPAYWPRCSICEAGGNCAHRDPAQAAPKAPETLTAAGWKYVEAYEGDDRLDIKTDVFNAFQAGAAFALKAAQADQPETLTPILKWTEPAPPNNECYYQHSTAQTPFGRLLITWKGWKDDPSLTLDEAPWPDSFIVGDSLGEVQEAAEARYRYLLKAAQVGQPKEPTPK